MAGEEMLEQSSERRRNRAGSNLNLNFNGGGVLLLLGAAAGALLASGFAAHRVRAHKRRRASMKDGVQRESCEHHASHEAKAFVGDEGEAGDGANAGEGVVQVNSHENLDASVQINQADQREIDFNLLEEWKREVAERSPETDIELVDAEDGKLAGCRDSSADTSSSPANVSRNLGSGSSLEENRLRYDDSELVASSVKEEHEFSCITSKEDDDEDSKRDDREEWGEREEIDEKKTSSNCFSEQSRLLEDNSYNHLHLGEASKFVEDEEEAEGGANTREQIVQIGSSPVNVHNNMEIYSSLGEDQLRYDDEQLVADSFREEIEAPFINRKEDEEDNKKACIEEWGERKELEGEITHSIRNVEDLYLPKIGSSSMNDHNNMGIYSSLGEGQLRYDDEQLVADSFREEIEAPFINREEDDEDNKKSYIEKWGERKELEEKITHSILNVEDLCLPKIGSSPMNIHNNMRISSSLGEDQLRYDDEQLVATSFREEIEAPFINREENEEDNKKAYIEEWVERKALEEKITQSILNAEDLCLPKKTAFQNLEVVVAIEERTIEYGFMDETYNSILEFVLSRAKEMTISSPLGDQDEINQLFEKMEPFFGTNGEAKQALTMTQNDSSNHLEMVIMEDETIMESGAFKDAASVHILRVEQDNDNGDASNDKMVEGSRGLCEQTGALPHDSTVTIIAEPEMNSHKDSSVIIAKEDDQLTTHTNGIVSIEEDKKKVEESNHSLVDEGVEGLFVEIQGIEDDKLNSSKKTLEREECQAGNQAVGTSPDEVEREVEIILVQLQEIETRHCIEAHNDKLERETEFPQNLSVVEKGVGEILNESQSQIKEVEERQILKLSFDLVEKGVKITNTTIKHDAKTELIDVDKKHQCQAEGYENNLSSEGKLQRIAVKKAKGMEYMFGHIFVVTTLTAAFAILAFLYAKDFFTRTSILQKNFTS